MSLQEAFNLFIQDRQSYCEKATIKYYQENVSKFIDYLDDEYDIFDMLQLQKEHYVSYLTYLRSCNIKNTSIHTYLRAVRTFLNFCLDNNFIQEDITHRVKLPKPDAALKVPLSSAEVDQIDSVFDLSEKGMRNYLIVHCMLDLGMRRQEVMNLKIQDINMDAHYITIVKSKNNKSRVVPVPEFLFEYMMKYYNLYSRCEYVFVQLRGRAPLTEETIKQLFQDLKVETGVQRLHPHLLRHTFASSYMLYCGDIYMLKILLGHSKVNTTEEYVHIANQMKLIHYDMYKIDDVFLLKKK